MADLPNKPAEMPLKPAESPASEPAVASEFAPEPEPAREREGREPASEPVREAPPSPVEAPPPPAPVRVARPAPAIPSNKDPMIEKIEGVLAEDLTDAFLKMSPDTQAEFKRKGEETADKIREMIQQAKVNARKIFDLIRDWLKVIPGVNRFFLEQEAKIKTDKILRLKP